MWKKRQRSVLFSHVLPIFQLVSNVNVFLFFSLIRILNDYPQRAATAACLLLMVEPDWCGPSRTPPVWYINMIYFFFNGKRSCLDPLNTKGTFIGYLTHTYTHTERERGTVRQNPFLSVILPDGTENHFSTAVWCQHPLLEGLCNSTISHC